MDNTYENQSEKCELSFNIKERTACKRSSCTNILLNLNNNHIQNILLHTNMLHLEKNTLSENGEINSFLVKPHSISTLAQQHKTNNDEKYETNFESLGGSLNEGTPKTVKLANEDSLKRVEMSSYVLEKRQAKSERKNPLRKARMTRASLDLIEKLTIPASIFNARIKNRNNTRPMSHNVVRELDNTTGAVYSPPGLLTRNDFKEWPITGMHERPFYDPNTDTIIKYHIPNPDVNVVARSHSVLTETSGYSEQEDTGKRYQ